MAEATITQLTAREILDSRGDPTVEVAIELSDGTREVASAPSGASTGAHEAVELRDQDPQRYEGKGVMRACRNVNADIAGALVGQPVSDQAAIDRQLIALDGTADKRRLGANAILGVSLAVLRVAAQSQHLEVFEYVSRLADTPVRKEQLPVPLFNVINGGKHADTNICLQEHWLIPVSRSLSTREKVRQGSEIFHALGKILKEENADTDLGNEGGYAPAVTTSRQPFDWIMRAITAAGYQPGDEIALGVDAGATALYDTAKKQYLLSTDRSVMSPTALIDWYASLIATYPIRLLEDGLAENDLDGWQALTGRLGHTITIIGDDLFCTNLDLLQRGITRGLGNGVIIKPNQIGTVTETLAFSALARQNGYTTIASHRSGDTEDTTIVDIAVGLGCAYMKTGSLARGERVVKYNRLMEIEDRLTV